MSEEADRRLVELETKSSFQEAAILDMSKILIEQATRLDKLEATVRDLREKMKESAGGGQPPLPVGERPPHY